MILNFEINKLFITKMFTVITTTYSIDKNDDTNISVDIHIQYSTNLNIKVFYYDNWKVEVYVNISEI